MHKASRLSMGKRPVWVEDSKIERRCQSSFQTSLDQNVLAHRKRFCELSQKQNYSKLYIHLTKG